MNFPTERKPTVLFCSHSDVSGWTIQLGITRRHAHSYYGQKMKVRRVVPHPAYNVGVAHDNDVALFQLSSRVTFHEHLLPVCLPPANKELVPGTVCTVIGWGKKEDTGSKIALFHYPIKTIILFCLCPQCLNTSRKLTKWKFQY